MSQRDRIEIGVCPKCAQGTVTCTHNRFVKDEQIDSWEHRCGDCGYRDTQAERAAPDPPDLPPKPATCPLCGRQVDYRDE